MIWAIIPARAGSQGIKNKNVRQLGGKPLYRWVLETAVKSGLFQKIILSTNIRSIIEDSSYPNVEILERPERLCQGEPGSIKNVVKYVLARSDARCNYFALLQPTSPFLRVVDIEMAVKAVQLLPYTDSCQTIRRVKHHDHAFNQRIMTKPGKVEFVFPDKRDDVRRQAQPEHYALGNLIITKTEYFLRTNDFFGNSIGIEIPWKYGIDIDHESDLELAEILCREFQIKN